VLKTTYFVFADAPPQFLLTAALQLVLDAVLFGQAHAHLPVPPSTSQLLKCPVTATPYPCSPPFSSSCTTDFLFYSPRSAAAPTMSSRPHYPFDRPIIHLIGLHCRASQPTLALCVASTAATEHSVSNVTGTNKYIATPATNVPYAAMGNACRLPALRGPPGLGGDFTTNAHSMKSSASGDAAAAPDTDSRL
jgi:hypothetical protein